MAEAPVGAGPGTSGEAEGIAVDPRPTHLVDSDVLIWALRGDAPTVEMLSDMADQPGVVLACSVVTLFEVRAGMRPGEEPQVQTLLDSMVCLAVDDSIAIRAADYYRSFRATGTTLHIADLLIAGTATTHRIPLITYNQADFPMADIELHEAMPPAPTGRPRR